MTLPFWIIQMSRKYCVVIRVSGGSVVDKALAPIIEYMSVWIQKIIGYISVDPITSRIETSNTTISVPYRTIGSFNLRAMENSFLKIDPAIGTNNKTIG